MVSTQFILLEQFSHFWFQCQVASCQSNLHFAHFAFVKGQRPLGPPRQKDLQARTNSCFLPGKGHATAVQLQPKSWERNPFPAQIIGRFLPCVKSCFRFPHQIREIDSCTFSGVTGLLLAKEIFSQESHKFQHSERKQDLGLQAKGKTAAIRIVPAHADQSQEQSTTWVGPVRKGNLPRYDLTGRCFSISSAWRPLTLSCMSWAHISWMKLPLFLPSADGTRIWWWQSRVWGINGCCQEIVCEPKTSFLQHQLRATESNFQTPQQRNGVLLSMKPPSWWLVCCGNKMPGKKQRKLTEKPVWVCGTERRKILKHAGCCSSRCWWLTVWWPFAVDEVEGMSCFVKEAIFECLLLFRCGLLQVHCGWKFVSDSRQETTKSHTRITLSPSASLEMSSPRWFFSDGAPQMAAHSSGADIALVLGVEGHKVWE